MVDAGSSGWRDFADFRRRIIDTAQTRVLAMIHIVGVGMLSEDDAVDQNQFDMNPALVAEVARKKRRLDRRHQNSALETEEFHFSGEGGGSGQSGESAGDGRLRILRQTVSDAGH